MKELNKMEDNTSALELSFLIGTLLLQNGAEISRVQDTMERVVKAYNVNEFGVYVLTNGIFANGVENGISKHTAIKFVKSSSIHFGRIAAVNQLSREICEGKHNVPEAMAIAKKIKDIPYSPDWLMILSSGIGCAGFCYVFGGTVRDTVAAFIVGLIVQAFLTLADKQHMGKITSNLIASSLAAAGAIFFLKLGLGQNLEYIIAGSLIRLVPGVALTTAIRDFFNSDYLSGTIRIIDVVILGGCIAIGAGVIVKLASILALL